MAARTANADCMLRKWAKLPFSAPAQTACRSLFRFRRKRSQGNTVPLLPFSLYKVKQSQQIYEQASALSFFSAFRIKNPGTFNAQNTLTLVYHIPIAILLPLHEQIVNIADFPHGFQQTFSGTEKAETTGQPHLSVFIKHLSPF